MSTLLSEYPTPLANMRPATPVAAQAFGEASATKTTRVAFIDTRSLINELFLNALCIVNPALDCTVFVSASAWLDAVRPDERDIVLLSLDRQPGRTAEDCVNDLRLLQQRSPNTPLIVVSSKENPEAVCNALDLGAAGYVSTTMHVRAVVEVIRLVQSGAGYVPLASFQALRRQPPVPVEIAEPRPDTVLSPRETLIAKALRTGTPNKIIAYDLNMCESTVKVHVRHIMKKLKAKNRTQVAYLTNKLFHEQVERG